jgi:carbon monoxide dehydrogenase subunit G
MDIIGDRLLLAPRNLVWRSLFDAALLSQCIPGCEMVERESESVFKVTTLLTIGPLKARFSGTLSIADAEAPQCCTLLFDGQGGAAGMAKGSAKVVLTEVDGGTQLSYSAQVNISGKLAQVGSRLVDSVAKKLSIMFFDKFEAAVAQSIQQP